MSDYESILRQEAGVKDHPSESPPTVGLKAGAFADVGSLILTNKRLVYINKGGSERAAAWAIGGVFAAQAIENSASQAQLDELSSQEGSYSIPLANITRVEAAKKMGQSYIRVDATGLAKPVHSFVVAGGTDNQAWAAAINQAKTAMQYGPTTQAAYAPQPVQQAYAQPQTSAQKACPRCGVPDTGSKFCTSCGTPLQQNQLQTTMPPPPPPPPTQAPTCPTCGRPIRYIQQYQRWYCDQEKRYL